MIVKPEHYHDEQGRVIATLVRTRDAEPNSAEFFTPADSIIQVGLLSRVKGSKVPPHVHRPVRRSTVGTAEVLIVMQGWVRVTLYGTWGGETVEMAAGDALILEPGVGHSLEMLEDARILECKSGPYLGREADKEETDGQEVEPEVAGGQGGGGGDLGHPRARSIILQYGGDVEYPPDPSVETGPLLGSGVRALVQVEGSVEASDLLAVPEEADRSEPVDP